MWAMTRTTYGPPSVMERSTRESPTPGPGEVCVAVRASSMNQGDLYVVLGEPWPLRLVLGLIPPPVPGQDLAGIVEAIGSGVESVSVGDRVVGQVHMGAWAEHVIVPENQLVRLPDEVSFEVAATLPLAGQTALQGIQKGGVKAGDRVLVNGGSGSVGSFCVQIASLLGAEVTAVCSTRNVDRARRLGADEVIDYTEVDVAGLDRTFDVVLDVAASLPVHATMGLVADGGTLVAIGAAKGGFFSILTRMLGWAWTGAFGSKTTVVFDQAIVREDLEQLVRWAAEGRLQPGIVDAMPFREVRRALELQATGRLQGKVVLTP